MGLNPDLDLPTLNLTAFVFKINLLVPSRLHLCLPSDLFF
jgi:hypothetical protein